MVTKSEQNFPPLNPYYKHDGPLIKFPLSDGSRCLIMLDNRVSKEDFEKIKSVLDLAEPSFIKFQE